MEDKSNREYSDDGHCHYKRENEFNKCETLDKGTFAFMHWLNSKDKKSLSSIVTPCFVEIC